MKHILEVPGDSPLPIFVSPSEFFFSLFEVCKQVMLLYGSVLFSNSVASVFDNV